jgi:hypothetical protein
VLQEGRGRPIGIKADRGSVWLSRNPTGKRKRCRTLTNRRATALVLTGIKSQFQFHGYTFYSRDAVHIFDYWAVNLVTVFGIYVLPISLPFPVMRPQRCATISSSQLTYVESNRILSASYSISTLVSSVKPCAIT